MNSSLLYLLFGLNTQLFRFPALPSSAGAQEGKAGSLVAEPREKHGPEEVGAISSHMRVWGPLHARSRCRLELSRTCPASHLGWFHGRSLCRPGSSPTCA